jgi:hypothetical protein
MPKELAWIVLALLAGVLIVGALIARAVSG